MEPHGFGAHQRKMDAPFFSYIVLTIKSDFDLKSVNHAARMCECTQSYVHTHRGRERKKTSILPAGAEINLTSL